MRVVAERIEDETATVAEAVWPIQSGNSDAEELAKPRRPPVEGKSHVTVSRLYGVQEFLSVCTEENRTLELVPF